MKGLSPTEYKLLSFMRARGVGIEVSIDDMWVELTGDYVNSDAMRDKQQYVGAFVSRINAKSDTHKIVPGAKLKHTYCVVEKKKTTT
jgi:hypothetical protein